MKYVYKFLEHQSYEDRRNPLTEAKFKKLLNSNCQEWCQNPIPLTRFQRYTNNYELITPKKGLRKSLNKKGYINMLMANLPSWSNFPDRRSSIIFSTPYKNGSSWSPDYRVVFGNYLYFVIPYDNANFGLCPSEDLWSTTNVINDFALDEHLAHKFEELHFPENYKGFLNRFTEIWDPEFNQELPLDLKKMKEGYYNSQEALKRMGITTPIEYLNYILGPELFHDRFNDDKIFESGDYNHLQSYLSKDKNHEGWTDSKCLLVGVNINIKKSNYSEKEFQSIANNEFKKITHLIN